MDENAPYFKILKNAFADLRSGSFQKIKTGSIATTDAKDLLSEYNKTIDFLIEMDNERKENFRLFNESQKTAQQASHSKSRFLANMSHEIRTPINGIIGLARMIQDAPLSADQNVQLEMLLDSAHYLHSLINDILDLTKIEEGKLRMEITLFSLVEVVDMVVNTVQFAAQKKNINLHIENSYTDDRFLLGDPLRLRQVLINLLSNAVKFTPDSGSVILKIAVKEMTSEHAYLSIEVIDSGIGLDQETIDRLFKPFEQADASTTRHFGGTGLGLSICKKLVQLMHGEIGVTSVLSQGATFWFTSRFDLGPGMDNLIPDISIPEWLADDIVEKKPPIKVLMAEDHPVNQIVMKALLEKYNLEVEIANNGIEAIEAAKSGKYKLIFMDCQMPEMDGYEATKHIRSLPNVEISSLPIIALTANAMSGDKEHCLAVGMNGFISKPVEIPQLEAQLRLWLRGA